MRARRQAEPDRQLEVPDERLELAVGVRHETDDQARRGQPLDHRVDVVVQGEVPGVVPGLAGRPGHLEAALAGAAHPLDDQLGEAGVLLAAVVERAAPPEHPGQRVLPGLLVAGRVERHPERRRELGVALAAEHPRRVQDREVDVEQDDGHACQG